MTAPAVIKRSDLRRVADMVKETGVIIEVERNGTKFRVMPNTPDIHSPKPIASYEDIDL